MQRHARWNTGDHTLSEEKEQKLINTNWSMLLLSTKKNTFTKFSKNLWVYQSDRKKQETVKSCRQQTRRYVRVLQDT